MRLRVGLPLLDFGSIIISGTQTQHIGVREPFEESIQTDNALRLLASGKRSLCAQQRMREKMWRTTEKMRNFLRCAWPHRMRRINIPLLAILHVNPSVRRPGSEEKHRNSCFFFFRFQIQAWVSHQTPTKCTRSYYDIFRRAFHFSTISSLCRISDGII